MSQHEHDDELSRLRAEAEFLQQQLAETEARLAKLQAEGALTDDLLRRLRPGQTVMLRVIAGMPSDYAAAWLTSNAGFSSSVTHETSRDPAVALRSVLLQLPALAEPPPEAAAPLFGDGWQVVPGNARRLTVQEYAAHYFGVPA
jgi:hypothetical protein